MTGRNESARAWFLSSPSEVVGMRLRLTILLAWGALSSPGLASEVTYYE